MESREFSKRLGVISPGQLQAALDQFQLGRLVSAEPAPGGLFGQNVFIETTSGRYVLRGHPHGDWHLPKEQRFVDLIHAQGGPPVPWPYRVGDSRGIFDWPTTNFAIMPRLPGVSAEAAFGGNHRAAGDPAFARSAGAMLGRLHEVRFTDPGPFQHRIDPLRPLTELWAESIPRQIRAKVAESRAVSGSTTDADVAWAEAVIASATYALREPFEPTVIHLDYAPGNLVGGPADTGWTVGGIVDWMTAEAGDAEADLCRMLALYIDLGESADHFMGGYRSIRPQRPGFAERFRVYMLLDRLHLWEYGQRNGGWFKAGVSMRDWVEPYLLRPNVT